MMVSPPNHAQLCPCRVRAVLVYGLLVFLSSPSLRSHPVRRVGVETVDRQSHKGDAHNEQDFCWYLPDEIQSDLKHCCPGAYTTYWTNGAVGYTDTMMPCHESCHRLRHHYDRHLVHLDDVWQYGMRNRIEDARRDDVALCSHCGALFWASLRAVLISYFI